MGYGTSDKNWGVLVVLSVVLGWAGIDRFYAGYIGLGILKLITAGGAGIWALVDSILAIAKKYKDSDGYYITDGGKAAPIVMAVVLVIGSLILYKSNAIPQVTHMANTINAKVDSFFDGLGSGGKQPAAETDNTPKAFATTDVNLRAEPSGNAAIIRTIMQGETVTVLGDLSGGWLPVESSGDKGWVSGEFISR